MVGRAKTVGPAGEVTLGKSGGRNVLGFSKSSLAGQRQYLRRRKEAEEWRPACSRSFLRHLSPGRTSGSASSSGSKNVMASVDPGASAATRRSVALFASLVRYMLTPVETTIAGLLSSKPAVMSPSRQVASRLEIDRDKT